LDGIAAGINLHVNDNVLESNDVSLGLAGTDGGDVWDVFLRGNTLAHSADGASRPYTAVQAGFWIRPIHDVQIISPRLAGGATLNFAWVGSGLKDVSVVWTVTVAVVDGSGQPLAGAAVAVLDKDGTQVASGTTAADGTVALPLVATVYRQTGTNPSSITTDQRGPFRVTATLGTLSASASVDLTTDITLPLTLS